VDTKQVAAVHVAGGEGERENWKEGGKKARGLQPIHPLAPKSFFFSRKSFDVGKQFNFTVCH